MSTRVPRRRQRTRGPLIGSLLALTLMVVGVVWLESIAPEAELEDRRVSGVPPLATQDVRSCTRPAGTDIAAEIRLEIPDGGRISSAQVYACPAAFDLLDVTFVGELIGDIITRDGGAWVQVNDDDYALEVGPLLGHREQRGFNTGLSVFLPEELLTDVTGVGRAEVRGDVVELRGRLLRTDAEDGGGITLRAHELEVLAPSERFPAPFHGVQAIVAAVLALLAIASGVWARSTRQR
jgi:hypothetical protein